MARMVMDEGKTIPPFVKKGDRIIVSSIEL